MSLATARPALAVALGSLLALASMTSSASVAAASPDGARPWAEGVPAERQARAFRLFDQGNRSFEEARYGDALQRYREALLVWDHPILHFNIAVCLIQLDRPVSAYRHLERAMVYGAAPLGEDLHEQGLAYRRQLLARLARIELRCEQAGAEVSLDGQSLLVCPGRVTRLVLPGRHQIVARRPRHLTSVQNVALVPGTRVAQVIPPLALEASAPLERRWRTWVPWTVVGSGIGVAAAGVVLRRMASSDFTAYDRAFAAACPAGCNEDEVPAAVNDLRDTARMENGAAIGSLSAGAALVAAGAVMLFLNQPRPVAREERDEARASAAPLLVDGGLGLALSLRF